MRTLAQKIISWTLVGQGRADEALLAFASVEKIVDASLSIDTAPADAPPLFVATMTMEGRLPPPPIVMERWPWRGSFADARNAALLFAEQAGADFSCMLDSDEKTLCADPVALRAWLAALPDTIEVVLVHHVDESHARERFFRHPVRHRFVGRTHEKFVVDGDSRAIAPPELIRWWEAAKAPEDLRAKHERDIDLLRLDIADDPTNGSAYMYLGMALQGLDRHQEAVDAFRECIKHDMLESGAWACFRAGESLLELGQYDRALDAALAGMARDAGLAELPWLAALASLRVGRLEQARCWAEIARVHGKGSAAERRRVCFRVLRGLDEGPEEVLAFCREHGA